MRPKPSKIKKKVQEFWHKRQAHIRFQIIVQ